MTHFQKNLIISWFQENFSPQLEALILFGSQVSGEAHEGSDWDLLVVVKHDVKITRSLYRNWDEISFEKGWGRVNPHFVHYPIHPLEAHSLWLEVALNHNIWWEREETGSYVISEIKKIIQGSFVQRAYTHGQPYWVWTK